MEALLRERLVHAVGKESQENVQARQHFSSQRKLKKIARSKSASALLDMSFAFVSEAVRDLAYEGLTFSIRRSLHRKIAEWYEYTYPNELNAHNSLLARHWDLGDVPSKAYGYYFQAAKASQSTGNDAKLLESALMARDLAQTCENDTGSTEHKLLIAHLDILIFKASYGGHLEDERSVIQVYQRLREALKVLIGFDFGGGVCASVSQLGLLGLSHSWVVDKYVDLSSMTLRKPEDKLGGQELTPRRKEALIDCFYALGPLAIEVQNENIRGVPIGLKGAVLMGITLNYFRIAAEVADTVMVGIA